MAGKPKGAKGGCPAFDVLPEFRMLVLRSRHGLSLEATGKAVWDRPGWMRFCGSGLADRVPDANTLWDFREALIKAGELMPCPRSLSGSSTRRASSPDPAGGRNSAALGAAGSGGGRRHGRSDDRGRG